MNAILLVALSWFDFLSVQRGINIAGGILLAISLALGIGNAFGADFTLVGFAGSLGAMLILLTPVFTAGGSLRVLSARKATQLLPHGRAKVMYGVTLAITLMAMIATLPVLFEQMGEHAVRHGNPIAQARPLEVFAVAWACAALFCIVTFIASASAARALLVLFVPVVLTQLDLALAKYLPNTVGSLAIAVIAWLGFAAWYVRAKSVRPTASSRAKLPGVARLATPAHSPASEHSAFPRTMAIRQYLLGTPSLERTSLWSAATTMVTAAVLWLFVRKGGPNVLLVSMLATGYFALVIGVMFGRVPAQRARFLWLRAGIDREGLFRIAERMGMTSVLVLAGIATTGLAAWSLTQRPDLAPHILLAVPLQLALALCLFYACLGYTGNWSPAAALLDIVVAAWLLVVILLPRPLHNLPRTSILLLAVTAALTLVLRARAQRRWRTVVWHPLPVINRQPD